MGRGLLITLFVAALAATGYLARERYLDSLPTAVAETVAQRSESIHSAFVEPVEVELEPELHAELEDYFTRLGKAFRDVDEVALGELFAAQVMMDYVKRQGLFDWNRLEKGQQKLIQEILVEQLGSLLAQQATFYVYDEFRIQRVERIRENELIVYLRVLDTENGIPAKNRWWLLRDGKHGWRSYDHEDLDSAIRYSASLAIGLTAGMGGRTSWTKDAVEMFRLFQVWWDEDAEVGGETIEIAEKVISQRPPKMLESFAWVVIASIRTYDEEYEAALEAVAKVEEISGLIPLIHYQRGSCLSGLERYDEALEEFDRYAAMLGWDADLHEMVADCHYGKGDLELAAKHARKGLADHPQSIGCLLTLAISLPADGRDELVGHFEKFEDKETTYEEVLDYALDMENDGVVDLVFPMLKRDFPESYLVEYYEEEMVASEMEDKKEESPEES